MSVTEIVIYVAVLIFCLVLSGFFASSETAFIALEEYRIEHLVNTNVKGASRIARLMERPERFLSTCSRYQPHQYCRHRFKHVASRFALGTQWGTIIATIVLTASS